MENHKSIHDRSQAEIDAYNLEVQFLCENSSDQVYICSRCRQFTCIENSFSNKLENLICCHCVSKAAKEHDMSIAQYLNKYVWKNA